MDARSVRVFVANYAGHDYAEAEPFGEIRYITKGFISFGNLDRVKYQIAESILNTTKDDWLLLSGVSIINVLSALLWYERHGIVKLLNYDKSGGKYREMILTPGHLSQLLEMLAAEG